MSIDYWWVGLVGLLVFGLDPPNPECGRTDGRVGTNPARPDRGWLAELQFLVGYRAADIIWGQAVLSVADGFKDTSSRTRFGIRSCSAAAAHAQSGKILCGGQGDIYRHIMQGVLDNIEFNGMIRSNVRASGPFHPCFGFQSLHAACPSACLFAGYRPSNPTQFHSNALHCPVRSGQYSNTVQSTMQAIRAAVVPFECMHNHQFVIRLVRTHTYSALGTVKHCDTRAVL